VRHLLRDGADIEERGGENHTTPLLAAARLASADRNDVVPLLLVYGADASSRNEHGETPLHLAAFAGYAETSRQLLDHGADVHAKSDGGWTALHYAAHSNHTNAARVLLERGADIYPRNVYGETPGEASPHTATAASSLHFLAILKAEAGRRAKSEAFAMGQHERLGMGSWVRGLDVGVVRMVLEHV